jgi:hypothetical protein
MADRILCLSWTDGVSGRELQSLEAFSEAVGFFGSLREAGQIEDLDIVLFSLNFEIDGMMLIRGSHAQLDAVREDERFRRLVIGAQLSVEGLRLAEGYLNAAAGEQMSWFQEAVAQQPQPVSA